MRRGEGLVVALALLAACTAPPSPPPRPTATVPPKPTPTETPTPVETPSPTALPPTPTPGATAEPPVKPTAVPTAPVSPTPFASPIETPAPCPSDQPWLDPPSRSLPVAETRPDPPRRVPNAVRSFWVADSTTDARRSIEARLRVQTEHVAMWVEQGVWHDVRRLQPAVEVFETQIYSRTRAAFGSEWTPGVDNDPRIHVLHAVGLGENVLGYTSGIDDYPRDAYPLSNQAEMITVNLDRVNVGSPDYYALLARQLQRLIQRHQDRNEERWVKEGLAELAAALNGFDTAPLRQAYLEQTDVSLTAWHDSQAQRGAVTLFFTYFHQRFGDAGTRILTSEAANGVAGVDAALKTLGTASAFEDLFADWLAANALDGAPQAPGSPYAYEGMDLDQPRAAAVHDTYPVEVLTSTQQYGADYIPLRGDAPVRVRFAGQTETRLLSAVPHSGQCAWWSNQADASLTTLVRSFDLSPVDRATLTYWTWYDIEPHYDYASVEVSTDDGQQWHVLVTPSGTDGDPTGNNPGWGYTGKSAGWIREEIDLSDYAGEEILVRFSYLTDEAVTGEGFLVDDISLPELGYEDPVDGSPDGWTARGFVITDGLVPQGYLALLIGQGPNDTFERLPVEQDQTGDWTVPLGRGDAHELTLVLAGMAPLTSESAPYELSLSH